MDLIKDAMDAAVFLCAVLDSDAQMELPPCYLAKKRAKNTFLVTKFFFSNQHQ